MLALRKRRKKEETFPIEICKFYRLNGECRELVDRLCPFKRINDNGFMNDHRRAICMKYKQEEV